jgi:phage baseplate assembly protein W
MAYNLVKIPAVDFKPSTALGVAIPFQAPNAFKSVYTTVEQTKYNILNYLLTDRGERPFNPNFGAGIRRRLFDPIIQEDLDTLKQSISNQIESYFPNVAVSTLDITPNYEESSISIIIKYNIRNLNTSDVLVLKVENQ